MGGRSLEQNDKQQSSAPVENKFDFWKGNKGLQ